MPRFFFRKEFWFYFAAGTLVGLAYVWIDVGILDESSVSHGALSAAHEVFDTLFPVLSGISISLGIFFLRQISRLNKSLSLKKARLEKELLFSTLISQMLHEIQGPIHNISAVFEDSEKEMSQEKMSMVRRNLDRLTELKKQYSERNLGLAAINPEEPVYFKKWLQPFVEDKIRSLMEKSRIRYEESAEPVILNIHSVLLEQVMLTLFSNALEALESVPAEQRELFLRAKVSSETPSLVEISMKNRGSFFPEELLERQAKKPSSSRHGLGLGLLLVNRMIEQVGGKMKLENTRDGASVTIFLAGGRA